MPDEIRLLELEQRVEALSHETQRSRRRVRIATTAGLLLLFLSAFAAPVAANHLLVRSSDIVNGQVRTPDLAPGAVTNAKIADKAVRRAQLAPGVVAARAYGTIWWPGTSVTNSRNLSTANVSHPATGIYCISGLNFTPTLAVGSSTNEWNAGRSFVSIWNADGSQTQGCPTGTQIQVRLYSVGGSTLVDSNFSIVIY